jgi:hypothetical protein
MAVKCARDNPDFCNISYNVYGVLVNNQSTPIEITVLGVLENRGEIVSAIRGNQGEEGEIVDAIRQNQGEEG